MMRAYVLLGLIALSFGCDDGDGETASPQPSLDSGPLRDMSVLVFDAARADRALSPDDGVPDPDAAPPDPDDGVPAPDASPPDPDDGVPDPDASPPDPDDGVPAPDASPPVDAGPILDMAPPPLDMEPVEMPCERVFVYRHEAGAAPTVALAGSFEGWTGGVPMRDEDGDGYFTAVVPLEPGDYEYKFIVNGGWVPDPDNPNRVNDGNDGFNSVAHHSCPFNPSCISGADCTAAAPICVYYSCAACECADGQLCDDQGRCVTPPQCLVDADCDALSERCEGNQCTPKPCDTHTFFLADAHTAGADGVYVTGSFNGWMVPGEGAFEMQRTAGGWWAEAAGLRNGAYQYKFVLARGEVMDWISDPNNPLQDPDGFGGFNSVFELDCGCQDASQCLDGLICQDHRCVPVDPGPIGECGDTRVLRWEDAVLYFVMVDRFYDSDGYSDYVEGVSGWEFDGASGQYQGGDLPGVVEKIPYLADLGVSAIWLSAPYENRNYRGPAINESVDQHMYSAYHGYWPRPENINYDDLDNPQPTPAVESRIGDADDLHDVVNGAHDAGMLVAFDYVMNHVDIDSGLFHAHEFDNWFARNQNGDFVMCADGNWEDPFWGTRCAFTNYLPAFNFDHQDALNWSVNDAIWWAKSFNL
ncbi:hypothetical protein KKF91_09505, partial [Myxococcota bacterium]|nr:hypothetical protein [Myxococcota bacterium]